MNPRVSPAEEAKIATLRREGLGLREIAERTGRSIGGIQHVLDRLGFSGPVPLANPKRKGKWSAEDIAIIRQRLEAGDTLKQILPHLKSKRSPSSLRDKVYKMGWYVVGGVPQLGPGPQERQPGPLLLVEPYSEWRKDFRDRFPMPEPNISPFIKVNKARLMAGR